MLTLLRLSLLGLVVAVFSLASPCQALITPGDVLFRPAADPNTAESMLNQQIMSTAVVVSGAHSTPADPVTPNDYYADSHTWVFGDLSVNKSGIFTLDKFNQLDELGRPRLINGDPVGQLQGMLLYFTVQLKRGRQVLDNESTTKEVANAIVEIGTSLTVLSGDSRIGVNCVISPSASARGKLFADTDGPDYPTKPLPIFELMSQGWIEAASIGTDRLAAIIDPTNVNPNDPNRSREEVNAIKLDTDPAHTAILAAFTSTGPNDKTASFSYASQYHENHTATQLAIGWSIPVKFDLEARVVYLYAAVPEPASMGLLAAAFAPVLLRRLRKRKSRLS